jgi:helicase MOV-10
MAGPDTVIVLSGDPKQLGPIIHSDIVKEFAYGQSYLERLLNLPVYDYNTGSGVR